MKLERLVKHNSSGEIFGFATDDTNGTEFWTDALNPEEVEQIKAQEGEWEGVERVDISDMSADEYEQYIARYTEIHQF